MSESLNILVVDDSLEYCQMVRDLLGLEGGFQIKVVHSLADMWRELNEGGLDALVLDNHLPDGDGLDTLPRLSETAINMPVVMVTGEGDQIVASEAIKRGAYDYIVKGESGLVQLPWILRRAVSQYRTRQAQKRAETRLYYQAWLLNNVGDAIVALDDTEKITYWNTGAEILFGQMQKDVVGKQILAVFTGTRYTGADRLIAVLSGEKAEDEFQITSAGEAPIWIHARAHSLRSGEGLISGLVGIFQNINTRKELEERFQHAQSRLIHAARLSALGELASNLAHEINNPLTTMLGEAQILIRELPEGSEASGAAKAIEEAGWRAADYVSQLINLSNPTEQEARPISVSTTLDQAIHYLQNRIATSTVKIDLKFPPDLPAVMAQERDLIDIWINLFTSILDSAVGSTTDVVVEALHVQTTVVIEIHTSREVPLRNEDRGAALAPRQLLGLAVAEELVRSVRGSVQFSELPGKPMLIQITLPATDALPDS
ncbi:MAG: response regulator [Anaerolineales bacterium]|nr:response regulator [Anaerolineales bacterium]